MPTRIDTRTCNLGEIVMSTKGRFINLFFLGAQKLENSTWRVHFNLHKIKDKEVKMWEELEYSFDIYLDLKEGEELEFADDFGEYKYRDVEKGFLKLGPDRVQEFYKYEKIRIEKINKDEIVVNLSYFTLYE